MHNYQVNLVPYADGKERWEVVTAEFVEFRDGHLVFRGPNGNYICGYNKTQWLDFNNEGQAEIKER